MTRTHASRIRRWLASPLLLVWLAAQTAESGLAAAAPGDPALIPSIFRPESTPAHTIHGLSMLVLAITGLIFVVVFGLIVYALVRYRRRPDDDGGEPAQVYGSTQVEIAWTVTPVLIVVVLSLTGARAIDRIQNAPRPAASLEVTAIGHQWWWEFRYPSLGIVTANELHVPVSDPASPTPTFLKLLSADVAHSFWVPRLAGKTDLIPNRVNEMWIDPGEAGPLPRAVRGVLRHPAREDAAARLRPRARRFRSLGRRAAPGRRRKSQNVAEGRRVFETTACINCHAVGGTVGTGTLRSRPHPSDEPRDARRPAPSPNTPENLRDLDREPGACEAGLADAGDEPDRRASSTQLVAYLETLR